MYLPYSRLLQVPDEEREFLTLDELKPHQLTELGIQNQICNSTAAAAAADALLIGSSQQHSHHHHNLQHSSPSNIQQINNHQQQSLLIINNNNNNNTNNNNNNNNSDNIINTINTINNTASFNNLQHQHQIHNLQPRQPLLQQSQSQQIYDAVPLGQHIFYDLNVQSNSDDSNSMYMNAGGLNHQSHNNVDQSINVIGNGITSGGSTSGGNNINNTTMDGGGGGGQLNSQPSQNLINSPSCRKRKNFYIDGSDFEDDTGDDAKSVKTIDENKKQNHSEIEKRRRDKMNTYITELSAMVPMCHAMSRKLDKLTVLRMAVQHLKTIRGAVHSYTEGRYKPDFLSDQELKMLILQAAEGFLFVVGCDRGRILFVSESVSQILNYSQGDLLGQSWFDILHPKDVAKVKEQLSSSDLSPRERLIDAKTMLPVKTDIPQGLTRLCPGARRSFFCRMKYKTIGTQIKGETDVNHTIVSPVSNVTTTSSTIAGQGSSISSCSTARRKKQINSDKKYCVVQCTGYLKSWAPAKMGIDDNENDVDGSDSCNLSCLVAVGRIPPNIYTLTNNIKSVSVTTNTNCKNKSNTNDNGTSSSSSSSASTTSGSSTINSNSTAATIQSLITDTIAADSSTSANINNNNNNLSTKESSSLASSSASSKSISFTSSINVNNGIAGSTTNHNYIQPITRTIQFISRHTMDGKFLFVDQRATLVLGFLPQELLGTSMYEYYQHSDIPTLAESHVAVLQSSDKITTNIYRFRTKDNGYVHLQSEWKAFKNPWTKEVEYLIAKNSVIFDCRTVNSNNNIPKSEHMNENQPPGNFAFFNQASPKEQIHKIINTHVETSKIGRQIAEQVLDYQRRISESSTESSPDPDTISRHSNSTHYLTNNGNSTIQNSSSGMDMSSDNASPFPSASNQQQRINTEYNNNQLRSTLVQSPDQDSDSEIIRLMGSSTIPETSNSTTTTDGNDDAAMAVIMSLLEADAGLGGPVDFTGLPWPLP